MPDSFFDQMGLDDNNGIVYCGRHVFPITKLIFPQGHSILYQVIRRFKRFSKFDEYFFPNIDVSKLILQQINRELTSQFPGEYIVECVGHSSSEWWDYFNRHIEPDIHFVLIFKTAQEQTRWVLRWL